MERWEAAKLVAVLLGAWPTQGYKLTEEQQLAMLDAFAVGLEDVAYEQAIASVRVLMHTCRFLPSVAEIRLATLTLKVGPPRSGGEAWGSVLKAIHAEGYDRVPGVDFVFVDKLTGWCVEQLGWQNLCSSQNAVADRARFIDLYEKESETMRREMQSPLLAEARRQRQIAPPAEVRALVAELSSALVTTDGGKRNGGGE